MTTLIAQVITPTLLAAKQPAWAVIEGMTTRRARKHLSYWAGRVRMTYRLHANELQVALPRVRERWIIRCKPDVALSLARDFRAPIRAV